MGTINDCLLKFQFIKNTSLIQTHGISQICFSKLFRQIINTLAAYKSRYFARPHPITVYYRPNFDPTKNCKVKLQSLVAKCCEIRKYSLAKFAKFVSISAQMRYAFPSVMQLYIQILCKLSQGYIFRILKHFATKRCHFTNFEMIFLAVLIHFVVSAKPKPKFSV